MLTAVHRGSVLSLRQYTVVHFLVIWWFQMYTLIWTEYKDSPFHLRTICLCWAGQMFVPMIRWLTHADCQETSTSGQMDTNCIPKQLPHRRLENSPVQLGYETFHA
jgi:hypothetical protein